MKYLPLFLSVCILSACASESTGPDVILTNGRVYTMSWDEPDREGLPSVNAPTVDGIWAADAEAIAIRGGKIVGVGSTADMEALASPDTRKIDLEGAWVVPGLIESHGHLHEIGEKAEQVNLIGAESEAELISRLEAISSRAPGEWILGSGWDEGSWANNLPTKDFLNTMFPENPVVLKGLRGFGTLGNDLALAAAGVDDSTVDPVGGRLVRDSEGHITGVFLDNATDMLNSAVPEMPLEQRKRILLYGVDRMLESGYVSTHHAGVRTDYLEAYLDLQENGELPIRVEAMLSAGPLNAPDVDEWTDRGPTRDSEAFLQIRSIKAYYDASLGSRGARMIEDYSDMPGHRGVSGEAYDFNAERVEKYLAAGFRAGIHAIGDAGNREVLDFYEDVYSRHPEARNLNNRIEHAQVIHPDDFARFAELGIVASMEPGHAVEDSPWAEDRVGPDRVKGAYAWRTLRRHGVPLLFNSDYTGTDWSFFYGLYAATTRKMKDGSPDGGWYPEQVVTNEEALRAYTVWPAFAARESDLTGTIETGKRADLTVMSIDPLNSHDADLLDGTILKTFVAGKEAYSR